MQSQQTTPSEEWRIRWTPDGSVIERWVDGEHKATGTHADAVAALAGVLDCSNAAERAYLFSGKTDTEIDLEMLARSIEDGLANSSPDPKTSGHSE